MANYTNLSDENQKLFKEILESTSLPQYVLFEVLANNKQKQLYKISKASDVVERITDGINFIVILNEEIFDLLTDEQQKIVFQECLAGVTYDVSKDVVGLNKPDFTSYRSVLEQFGHEEIIALNETIKSLYDEKKQREDEEKAQRKAKRQKKSFG